MALSLEKRSDNDYVVGSFAAKTYFSELLRMVENGSVVTITRNGHDIATVQSPQIKANKKALDAWKSLCSLGKEISAEAVTLEEIQEWKNDGQK